MKLTDATVLVTGANRGIGRQFALAAVERGATRVYATARRPESVEIDGVVPLALDVTDPASVAAAARSARDVDLVVNNAGITTFQDVVGGDPERLRAEMETNLWGVVSVMRAFAPVLGARGGGAFLNVLSALSWRAFPGSGGYHASKAAAWAVTNAARLELRDQGTQVTGLLIGSVDTDMMAHADIPKADPADIVRLAYDGLEAGALEVMDETSRAIKERLAEPAESHYADLLAGR